MGREIYESKYGGSMLYMFSRVSCTHRLISHCVSLMSGDSIYDKVGVLGNMTCSIHAHKIDEECLVQCSEMYTLGNRLILTACTSTN